MKKEKVLILVGLVAAVFFIGSCNKGGKNEHMVITAEEVKKIEKPIQIQASEMEA